MHRRIFCEVCAVPMDYTPKHYEEQGRDHEGCLMVMLTVAHYQCPECGALILESNLHTLEVIREH